MNQKLEQMTALIAEWQQSEVSIKKFCEERAINCATFHYWKKRVSLQSASNFVPVDLVALPGQIEYVHPSGQRIIFSRCVDVHFLKQLLA
jgi:hypothetical protein